MTVGNDTLTCYQGEDVVWQFTVTDVNVASIATWTITLVVKATAATADPPLLGPFTATIEGTLVCQITGNIDLPPDDYEYSLRRTNAGFSWQLAHGTLTVLDSAHVDL